MSESGKKKQNKVSGDTILKASVYLFSEYGYSGTTMRDIAKEVGILPGSLYAHIKSKEEILSEIVESGIQRFLDIENVITSSTNTPDDKLRKAIKAHVTVIAESPETMLIVFHQWRFLTGKKREKAIKMRRRYAKLFTSLLQEGIDCGIFSARLDVRVEVLSILGALNWVPEWYSPDGLYSADEIGDKIADILMFGLSRRPQ